MNFAKIKAALGPLDALLVLIPVALALDHLGVDRAWVFLVSALAIVPLAGLIGRATEQLSERTGPAVGGLLNATFGNASELIVALVALRQGQTAVVQASLTGSIIGNVLFVFGLSAFVGGIGRDKQTVNVTSASASGSSLHLAVIGLLVPSVLFQLSDATHTDRTVHVSYVISGILLVTYALGLVFSLKTHRHLNDEPETIASVEDAAHESRARVDDEPWPLWVAVLVLVLASVMTAVVSESLVGALEGALKTLHLNEAFVGVVILAIVGNAAEHSTAVMVARKGRLALAHAISVESSKQIALFVTPVLVLAGHFLVPAGARPMTLHFGLDEVVAAYVSVLVLNQIVADGETNWLEGAQLLALYAILAATFFFAG